jgi:predicted nuclease of predicted toxin-antitoxin system
LRLLVDEDSQAKTLVRLLRAAGHDVLTAEDAGLNSLADSEVLARAVTEVRALLTRNCGDFLALHEGHPDHRGILAVYQDTNPAANPAYADIVRAIGNVEGSGVALDGAFIVLNAWRW